MTRVLIIEDDERVRQTFADFLSSRGFEVEEAENALAGLAAAMERPPSVVLLDLNLPGLSGAEVVAKLSRQAPVLVVSGMDDAELWSTLSLGAFDYVTKPVDLEHLAALIDIALRSHPSR